MIAAITFTEDTSVFQIKCAAKRKFLEKYDVNENDIQLSTNQNKRKKIMIERVLHPRTNEEEAMTLALLKEFQTTKRHDNICCNQRLVREFKTHGANRCYLFLQDTARG